MSDLLQIALVAFLMTLAAAAVYAVGRGIVGAVRKITRHPKAHKAPKADRERPERVKRPRLPSAPVSRRDSWAVPLDLEAWPVCADMLKQPHLLVGGTTGSGKSTLAHSVIYSLSANLPLSASFYAIDLKRVELIQWRGLPHCKGIATTPEAALKTIETVNKIVDKRLDGMVRNGLTDYQGGDVYLIVDELAELLAVDRRRVVAGLSRIMRLGRAAHVHVIGFTQAPNRAKGGGLDPMLCQNFTAAVALRCRSAIESRQIIGVAGAENLPQYGYGLYWSSAGVNDIAIPYTSDDKIRERVQAWAH